MASRFTAPAIPKYPGLTHVREAAADRGVCEETLRIWLTELGLGTVRKPGHKGDGYGTSMAYVRNSDLDQVDTEYVPSRPASDEISIQEAARILWPGEAAELERLQRRAESEAVYKKLLRKHLGRVRALVASGRLTLLDKARRRRVPVKRTRRYQATQVTHEYFALRPTITLSKEQVLSLRRDGIRPAPLVLPAHWKTSQEIAKERGILWENSSRWNRNRHECQLPRRGFVMRLAAERKKDPAIAQQSWFTNAKGRPNWEWKYDTKRLYPIVDKPRWPTEAERAAALLDVLDKIDPEQKGVGYSRLSKAAKMDWGIYQRVVRALREWGKVETVDVLYRCGHPGSCLRTAKGIRRTAKSGQPPENNSGPASDKYPGHTLKLHTRGPRPHPDRLAFVEFCYDKYIVEDWSAGAVLKAIPDWFGNEGAESVYAPRTKAEVRLMATENSKRYQPPLTLERPKDNAPGGRS